MAAKGNWNDNFSELFKDIMPAEGNKEWRFALEEHKTKGTLQMNVRKFQKPTESNPYDGPTKNGFIESVNSIEDIEKLEKKFAEFFKKCKEMI